MIMSAVLAVTAGSVSAGEINPSFLRCEFEVNPVGVGADKPVLMWEVKATDPKARGLRQTAYRITVATSKSTLEKDSGDLWDSGKVESGETLGIAYGGKPLAGLQQIWWKVKLWDQNDRESAWSEPADWIMALKPGDWKAQWITRDWSKPYPGETAPLEKGLPYHEQLLPSPMFRRGFVVDKPIKRALLSATAAGCYEARINGKRLGDLAIEPGWTFSRKHYDKEPGYVLSRTTDVTAILSQGENVLAFILGDGWHRCRYMRAKDDWQERSNGHPTAVRAQLDIEYADGSHSTIATDADWRQYTDGPWRSSMYEGSRYDARKELPGWDAVGFDDRKWFPAVISKGYANLEIVPYVGAPITVAHELKPISIKESTPGVWMVDFGQDLAGVCRVALEGAAGTTVKLRHGQFLNPDGSLFTANLGGNRHNFDGYTLAGGPLTEEARFTYHGFRYVQIEGLPSRAALKEIRALALADTVRRVGHFESSDPRLNRLWENNYWSLLSNLKSVITDCVGRDERRGWAECGYQAYYHFDLANFMLKVLRDCRFEQHPSGLYDDVAPFGQFRQYKKNPEDYRPGWGDCGVQYAWNAHKHYGDRRILAEHYDSANRWTGHMKMLYPDLLVNTKSAHGEWLDFSSFKTPDPLADKAARPTNEALGNSFWYLMTRHLVRLAEASEHKQDAVEYRALAERLRQIFQEKVIDAEGKVGNGGQAAPALALDFGLVDDARRPKVLRQLLRAIDDFGGRLSTGMVATGPLLFALSDNGHHDLAWKLAMQPSFPSFGFMIDHGATTVWEPWDMLDREGKLSESANLIEPNHSELTEVTRWIFGYIGGIRPDPAHPGFKRFIIKPHTDAGPEWIKADYDSVRGRISCHWKRAGGKLEVEVVVPPNTSAEVWLPTVDAQAITEGGKPLQEAGLAALPGDNGKIKLELPSGSYIIDFAQMAPTETSIKK